MPNDGGAHESVFVRAARVILGVSFIGAGVSHFARPELFAAMVPRWLPNAPLLVAVSGAAEILGGIGLLVPTVRSAAGWGLIVLLIAVFPANVNMLQKAATDGSTLVRETALAIRLPLQLVLLWWVWRVALRRPPPPTMRV
ncbi:MAG TPA: DoxX family membrane protein [Gemmatimonadaceae bacterium]